MSFKRVWEEHDRNAEWYDDIPDILDDEVLSSGKDGSAQDGGGHIIHEKFPKQTLTSTERIWKGTETLESLPIFGLGYEWCLIRTGRLSEQKDLDAVD